VRIRTARLEDWVALMQDCINSARADVHAVGRVGYCLLSSRQVEALSTWRLPAAARPGALSELASSALLTLLEAEDFKQSRVASTLNVSRTTLMRMTRELGLPLAAELTLAEIEEARRESGGDVDQTARRLRVSARALKKRLSDRGGR